MKKIALLTLLLINLSLSFSLPRNQASPAIFSVTKTNNSILFRHTDSTLTAIPCQSVASIVSNADPSKIVSVWVVQQGDYDKIMQFDYLVCGFSSKSDAVDSLTAWATCDTSGGAYTTILYTNTDSATITSYDVLNSQNAPPGSPATGDIYLVGNSPSGAWVGHAKDIAEWDGADWVFTDGVQGDFLYNATNALTYIFRSGNWVQTTGIPALNNGNTISSGLRIGTNNARSLTFETNNANRGRFDSIGRFHVYNLPTATSADTFIWKANASGLATKVGQSTFLSGGAFIPLTGTEAGNPVTGTVVTQSDYNTIVSTQTAMNIGIGDDLNLVDNANQKSQVVFGKDSELFAFSAIEAVFDNNNGRSAILQLISDTSTANLILNIGSGVNDSRGFIGSSDFSPNITDLDYTQKIYVDNAISSNRKVDTSYIFRNATLDSTCMITVINGITYRSCAKDSVGSGTAYTFSTGLTNISSTITNNLSTGVSGGQSVIGGTASGNNLTLSSTSNATKGKILFGTSAYNEVNNRLGIGTSTPAASLDILGSYDFWGLNVRNSSVGALFQVSGGKAGFVGFNGSAYNNLDIRCGGSTQLFLSTNGNVGIADANPSQKLSLGGALYFSGLSAPSESVAIYAPEIFTLSFMTKSVERMRINDIGNVGIGTTTPVASAKLEVSSTTSGFLPPRMTATQASAISTPAQGLLLFVSDTNGTFTSVGWWGYNGATWEKLNN